MALAPTDPGLVGAVPTLADAAPPIAGPIATGAAALPADLPPPGAPVALPDLPGGVPDVPGPAELRATPAAMTAAPAVAASATPAAPIPPELQGIQDAANAQAAAAEDEGAAKAAADEAKAQAEADARVQHQLAAQEAADLRADHARAAQAAEDRTQAALVTARDAKIPDFWAGREGARTSAALMVGLGGAAAGLLGTAKNGAADIIQGNVDAFYRREKEKIDNLYKYAESQGKAQDDLRQRQAAELAELQIQHGATNLAIADHINEIIAASQGRIDMAAANAIKADRLAEGQKMVLQGRETLARIAYMDLRGQAALRKAKGAGSGSGGGGAVGDAVLKLKQAIIDGTDDGKGGKRALNAAEIQRFVIDNKLPIPPEAKAGHPSVASITKDVQFVAKSAADANKASDAGNNAVNNFVRTRFKDDKELAGDLKERQEVSKALALAKPGPDGNVSGVNFQQAIDATVKAATGLGARPQSIAVFQGSLGGVWNKVERAIQHGETGQYTVHDVQVLNDALKKQKAYVEGNLKEKEATYREEFSKHPTTKDHKDAWEAELRAKFGGVAHPSEAPLGATKVIGGKTYKKVGANDWQPVAP